MTVGPEGNVYVACWNGGSFAVLRSADAGASFTLTTFEDAEGNPDDRLLPFGINFEIQPISNGLPHNRFRTFSTRTVAADPVRPGQVYAAEAILVKDSFGNLVDGADVFFARSTDHSESWQQDFQLGPRDGAVLNDDNDGVIATGALDDEVIAGQALPRLAIDAQGNIAVIWYDTRRDPADHRLDVFGTISTDGGLTFSPNFRIISQSFDADVGAFLDANNEEIVYMGDLVGLALANKTAYAAWTDTRTGNQDIYFTSYAIDAPPPPLNDRFEPNDSPDLTESPTILGRLVERQLSKLTIEPGDDDWFLVQAAATGNLTISASQSAAGDHLQLELWNKEATTRLAIGTDLFNGDATITGERLVFPGASGEEYLVRVLPAVGSPGTRYALALESLTADLGTTVHGSVAGSLGSGDVALYRLAAGADGSLYVKLASGGNVQGELNLDLLDLDGQNVLASGQTIGGAGAGATDQASLAVRKSQELLVRVSGESASQGDFTLEFTNFDQFTTSQSEKLFVPAGLGPSQATAGHFNNDTHLDLVVSNALTNTLSLLLGNGDGDTGSDRPRRALRQW